MNFDDFISYLCSSVFNSVEKKDVKILQMKSGAEINFSALQNYRSLTEWEAMHEGKEVASIISEERIRTLFQPIIEAKTGEIYGYEALSRGILRDGRIMNPGRLFSSAKAMDLMFNLDRVCREASIRAASKQGIRKKLFINFIPTAIYEPSLCLRSTAKVLEEVNFDPAQVVFEVVETEKVEDFAHLNRILDYYKEKGFSTALDDLGSGYADKSALLMLKPDYMKIDMEIIRNIHLDEAKQKKLDEFITAGKEMNLTILAEGIETIEEYNYLKGKEIDLMQGYLFGKPEEVPMQMLSFR
ncbi:MAG TPA: EAL domain-containing protein [Clostridiaceae bacterium]|nr:EAL domain-containing protein [Clostridiaceae bacterium]